MRNLRAHENSTAVVFRCSFLLERIPAEYVSGGPANPTSPLEHADLVLDAVHVEHARETFPAGRRPGGEGAEAIECAVVGRARGDGRRAQAIARGLEERAALGHASGPRIVVVQLGGAAICILVALGCEERRE